ncbi:hypothetical protein PCANC_10628 [Puccinia coronata f. sp. avenae]|uniref:No apical meristem-associated C-terminal domain-containing protein n=1 Tax=Puccinia coronata f. sp. avenae TaxID=200324 RepID=A0A2N5V415_9BASI|nr:hypothetical protein PCASD_26168 [Puccinia coronata f. sp. avenae]PLW44741.1 hypothetical protein PCANC_10628 [Puccinia coronata f. sp. avenae]
MTTAKSQTSNFTPTEDEHLARSWYQVSQDPFTNNSQKRDAFWETITGTFNACTGGSRKTKSLMNSKSQKNVANTSTQSQPAPTSNPPSSNAPLSTPNLQNGTSEPNSKEPVRPIGIKRAKQQAASEYASKKKLQLLEKNAAKGQRQSKQMSEANAIQTETNKIQKRRANAKQALANIKIMDKDLATVTDEWLHE